MSVAISKHELFDDDWPSLGDVSYPPYNVKANWTKKQLKRLFYRPKPPVAVNPGKIHNSSVTLPDDKTFVLGGFKIEFKSSAGGQGPQLAISEDQVDSDQNTELWASLPGKNFVGGALVRLAISEERGSIHIEEKFQKSYAQQTIDAIELKEEGVLTVSGRLGTKGPPKDGAPRYALVFRTFSDKPRVLAFQLDIIGGDGGEKINQAHLIAASTADEHFFGFGEQFSHVDCKGFQIPVVCEEGGIGRGDAVPRVLSVLGVTGEAFSSYCPSPHFVTHKGRSLFLTSSEPSTFDLRAKTWFSIRVQASRMRGCLLAGKDPLDAIQLYTGLVGRMPPLPEWVHRGAIVGVQGGTDRAREIWAQLKQYETPIAGFWLQDWVGQRKTVIGKQLWWNWVLDRTRYEKWEDLVKDLEEAGVATGIYINPFLVDVPQKQLSDRRNLYQEAKERGFLVQNERQEVYHIPNTDFSAALLDLSNEEARTWIKDVIKTELLGSGAKFWMADFAEAAPFDGVYKSGESGLTYHNQYPVEWARINRDAIEEANREGDAWFFTRAGFLSTPNYTTAMWLGDQNVTWGEHDGLPSSIDGMLSSGFSGFSITHSDIGGYTSVSNILARLFCRSFVRTRELLYRWMEANAFTAIFRTHEGNEPGKNVQFYTDDDSLSTFARWSKVYTALGDYRSQLIQEAASIGLPLVRHPILHYPSDKKLYEASSAGHSFMLGSQMLIAPVVKPRVTKAKVYLPAGCWVHLWSGEIFGNANHGTHVNIASPIGQPPVFYVHGSKVMEDFVQKLQEYKILKPPSGEKREGPLDAKPTLY